MKKFRLDDEARRKLAGSSVAQASADFQRLGFGIRGIRGYTILSAWTGC